MQLLKIVEGILIHGLPYCNAKIVICNNVIAIGNDATQNDVFGNFGAKTFYVNCQINLCSLGRI